MDPPYPAVCSGRRSSSLLLSTLKRELPTFCSIPQAQQGLHRPGSLQQLAGRQARPSCTPGVVPKRVPEWRSVPALQEALYTALAQCCCQAIISCCTLCPLLFPCKLKHPMRFGKKVPCFFIMHVNSTPNSVHDTHYALHLVWQAASPVYIPEMPGVPDTMTAFCTR